MTSIRAKLTKILLFFIISCRMESPQSNFSQTSCNEFSNEMVTFKSVLNYCKEDLSGRSRPVRTCLIDIKDEFLGIGDSSNRVNSCQDEYRNVAIDTVFHTVMRQLNDISPSENGRVDLEVTSSLFTTLTIYWETTIGLLPEKTSSEYIDSIEQLDENREKLIAAIWSKISDQSNTDGVAISQLGDMLLRSSDYLNGAIEASVDSEFDPIPFLTPFLTDSISLFRQRLHTLVSVRDLYCKIKACNNNSDELEIDKILSVIALPVPNSSTQIAFSSFPSSNYEYFKAASEANKLISNSIFTNSNGANVRQFFKIDSLNKDVEGYLTEIRSLDRYKLNFAESGYYTSSAVGEVNFGLDEGSFNRIKAYSKKISRDLAEEESNLQQSYRNYLDRLSNQADMNIRNFEIKISQGVSQKQITRRLNELETLRSRIVEDQSKIDAYLRDLDKISEMDSQWFGRLTDTSSTIKIGASNTSYVPGINYDFSSKPHIPINANEVINFSVLGEFSPTCAIGKDLSENMADQGVLIGPSGFRVLNSETEQSITSTRTSTNKTEYHDENLSVSGCVKAGTPGGMVVSASLSACINYTKGKRIEESDSNSQTRSVTNMSNASFSAGIRLPSTPFPDLPAGSILALESKDGTIIKSVQILHRQSTIVASEDTNIYLVVNDCKNPPNENQASLTIDYVVQKSKAGAAKSMIEALIRLLPTLEEDLLDDIYSGRDINEDLRSLRSKITADISSATTTANSSSTVDHSFTTTPILRDLFYGIIDTKINMMANKSKIRKVELALEEIQWRLSLINSQQDELSRQQRIRDRIVRLEKNNVDLAANRQLINDTLDYYSSVLLPVVNIYYYEVFDNIDFSTIGSMSDLNSLDLNMDVFTLVKSISKIIDEVVEEVEKLETTTADTSTKSVMIAFERPGSDLGDISFPRGDKARSALLFRSLFGEGIDGEDSLQDKDINLSIFLNDFNDGKNTSAYLSCYDERPIIQNTYFSVVIDSDDLSAENFRMLNQMRHNIPTIFGDKQYFPDHRGRNLMSIANTNRSENIYVSFVPGNNIGMAQQLPNEYNFGIGAGKGFSPFSNLMIDSNFRLLFQNQSILPFVPEIKAIVLGFDVKVRSTSKKQTWMSACR